MSHFPLECLRNILHETEYLLEAAEGLSKEAFLTDATLKRAFVRSVEIIGEAAKKIPGALKIDRGLPLTLAISCAPVKYASLWWAPIERGTAGRRIAASSTPKGGISASLRQAEGTGF